MTNEQIGAEVRTLAMRIVESNLAELRQAALAVVKSRYECHGENAWDDLNQAIGNLADAIDYQGQV